MTTIKFWLMPNAGFESKQTIDRELKLFQELNPRIEVKCENLSWSQAWFKLIQALKDKSGPDLIQIGTTWVSTLSYLGAIQKLDQKKIPHNVFIPTFLNSCRCFGHLWALPWFCEGRVLYYRKDYLKKAGIEPSLLENWDYFQMACARLAKLRVKGRQVSPLGFSCQKEQAILQDLASWIWANGGDFLSRDGKHATLNHLESVQGFRFFLDLISSHGISKLSVEQSTGEVAENFFIHDAYAFLLSSSWPLQVYLNRSVKHYIGKKKAEAFGIAQIPGGGAGRYNFAGGSALAVTSFSSNPDKAWKLLEFLTGRESLTRYCGSIDMLPARGDVQVSLSADENMQDIFQKSINKYGRSFPVHPLWGSIEQVIVNGLVKTIRDFRQNNHDQTAFFQNLSEINQEIEYILSVFGE